MNQNQTFKYEVPGGFLWSPKVKRNGGRNPFYDSMKELRRGDIVFSFCDTYIKAIGIVQNEAVTSPKPDFRNAGSNWSDTGWFAEVEFMIVSDPIRPKDFMNEINPLLAEKYSPLQANGNGIQTVYLTKISESLGNMLLALSSVNPIEIENLLDKNATLELEMSREALPEFASGQSDPEFLQIIKARRGQGLFKANLRLVEDRCRVTGVREIRHLRASHIKPWSMSTDIEKLDGFNGLLLAPHVDHLFDRGYISFTDEGDFLIAKDLSMPILERWHINPDRNIGRFNSAQSEYLSFHRQEVFRY